MWKIKIKRIKHLGGGEGGGVEKNLKNVRRNKKP
jgi:hypothetical protein